MKKLVTISIVSALALSSLSSSVVASSEISTEKTVQSIINQKTDITSQDIQSRIKPPWASIGFKILKTLTNTFVTQKEATSTDDAYATIISSGTISFNKDGNGASVKHDVGIDYKGNWIDTVPNTNVLNWLDKIAVNITDTAGNYLKNQTVTHAQHTVLKTTYIGTYTVEYTATTKTPWDIWISVNKYGDPAYPTTLSEVDSQVEYTNTNGQKGYFVKESNGNLYKVPSNSHKNKTSALLPTSLTMEELSAQLFDDESVSYVSDFKDFSIGGKINFKDTIQEIEYDVQENYTVFSFKGKDENIVNWAFDGDLTEKYQVGTDLNLELEVVQEVGDFETLDYIKDAKMSKLAPSIDKYIIK